MDQSGLLHDRNEMTRWDQASSRVIPPDQGLGTGEAGGYEGYLGLVVEDDFFLVERLAQLIFQIEPADRRFGHFLCVEQASNAGHLGLFEGGLRVLEQRIGIGTVIRE